MPGLTDATFADLDPELATTRRVLDRVPDAHLGWRPHPKSWTLGELATHIVNLLHWWTTAVRDEGIDLAAQPPPREALPGRDAILEEWDRGVETLRAAIAATDDEALTAPWALRAGPRVLSIAPRHLVARQLGASHVIHHRGQLSVYLRLLDVPVPSIYGPTADEPAASGG